MREQPLVPEPEFASYYGRPILKPPVWKQPDVPMYLFLGGLAGASALLAEGAAMSGRPALERVGRIGAASGAAFGTVALVHDLGRPERFLNMLRVIKLTSPLSVGSWVLAPFSGLATAALASNLTGRLPVLGRLAGLGAGALGPALATYTAALITNTAVPAWHEAFQEMPWIFAGSGASAAGGLGMLGAPVDQAGPARRLAVIGAALELGGSELAIRRLGMLAEPYREGKPGMLMKTARALTAGSAAVALLGGRSRVLSGLAGAGLLVSSAITRFGIFGAGVASAKDPKYTVVPQRERLRRREAVGAAQG